MADSTDLPPDNTQPPDDTERDTIEPAVTGRDRGADLAAAFAELQNLMLDRPDVGEFLQQAAELAAGVLPEVSCGITLRRDHEVATVASSDDFALAVDEIQYGRGQGPCLQAMHTGQTVSVTDLAQDTRWAEYRIHALTYGVRSSLSIPLTLAGDTRGALNLYSPRPDTFGAAESHYTHALAAQTAGTLTMVLREVERVQLEEQLREALATRAVVDQAVGIVMGQRQVTSVQAFAVLRESSQHRNMKLRDIAAELIYTVTGQPPIPPRPFTDPR